MPQQFQHRPKVFGEGRSIALDRNAKIRIMTLARALMKREQPGKHWGVLTSKFVAVLGAILFGYHNYQTGKCYPSYETIAERADVARSTVYEAIHALERAGILTWVNRIIRIKDWGPDLFGRARNRWRVVRTSNAYAFVDPKVQTRPPDPSKSELQTGTRDPDLFSSVSRTLDPENRLHQALMRFGKAVKAETEGSSEGNIATAVP